MPDIDIRQTPALRVVGVKHTGPYPQIGNAFEQLFSILQQADAWEHMRGSIGVYYYNPTPVPEAEFRSHAGAIWAEGAPVPDGLEEVHIAAGRVGILRHKGPYDGIGAAWGQLYDDWVAESGEVPTGPCVFELYLNNPMNTAPEDLLTDLVLPIR